MYIPVYVIVFFLVACVLAAIVAPHEKHSRALIGDFAEGSVSKRIIILVIASIVMPVIVHMILAYAAYCVISSKEM